MRISVLTMMPETFEGFLREPVIRRAVDRKVVSIDIVDIRKYAKGSFRHIDDDTYGGGAGMVLRAQPILDALAQVTGEGDSCGAEAGSKAEAGSRMEAGGQAAGPASTRPQTVVCVMTPAGIPYGQRLARELAGKDHLVLICGHYEGIDERVMKHADLEISIGDYVLTGGELPARVVMDSVIRLKGGVLREQSTREESFEQGLLEYPQYTKPLIVEGERVPDALLSGDHERIRLWRLTQSLLRTLNRRPDLLEKRGLTAEERSLLEKQDLPAEERALLRKIPAISSADIFHDKEIC